MMIQAMLKEIKLRSMEIDDALETIYFGGGTPSLLEPNEIEALIQQVQNNFDSVSSPEVTLECNPDDTNIEKFKAWKMVGINRLSIGIQSFSDNDLIYLGRVHNSSMALKCLEQARHVGFDNISTDLIYGIPNSADYEIEKNIKIFNDFEIPHISAYALTIEEKTALKHFIETGKSKDIDESHQNDQFYLIRNILRSYSFEHYEVSNYAKNGYRSQHNSNYWNRKAYIGIGPSAHSYVAGKRRWNVSNNAKYMSAIQNKKEYFETEELSQKNIYNEKILTGLRRKEGILISELNPFETHFLSKAGQYLERKWLQEEKGRICWTEKGLLWLDLMSAEMFL